MAILRPFWSAVCACVNLDWISNKMNAVVRNFSNGGVFVYSWSEV